MQLLLLMWYVWCSTLVSYNNSVLKVKRGRWQLRGEVRSKSKSGVGGHYMLPGDLKDDPQALQTHVSKLLQEGKFMYKGLNLEVSIASWCKIYYEHYILPIDIHC